MPTDLPNERTLRRPGLVELDPSSDDIGADETAKLIGSRKVVGAAVYDRQGQRQGSIDEVMIDKVSGLVAYAVLSSGGFLGLAEAADGDGRQLARAGLLRQLLHDHR